MPKYMVGEELSYRCTVRDYMTIEADSREDAQQKMYEYLKAKIPDSATDIQIGKVSVFERQ